MMSNDPQRQITESELTNYDNTKLESIVVPRASVGFKILRNPMDAFSKENYLFAITFTCKISFSQLSEYKFKAVSITEIIDAGKPLQLWGLISIYKMEIEEIIKLFNLEIIKKEITLDSKFSNEIDPLIAEKFLIQELDRFQLLEPKRE